MSRASRLPQGRPRDSGHDQAILDAAEQLLARRGYQATTMVQIAAAAGVSKPTVYLRYPSKRELAEAMIDRLRPPIPTTSTGSATQDLIALVDMQRQWLDQHGLGIVAAVLLEQNEHPELIDRFQQRVSDPIRQAFQTTLHAGIARGELRPGADATEIIDALTGASWARTHGGGNVTPKWAKRLITGVLTGLAAPTTPGDSTNPNRAPTRDRPPPS